MILWVHPSNQLTPKAHRFIDAYGLRDRIIFAQDPESAAVDTLRVRLESPEPMEEGVPHPTTFLLDREGIVRFVDVRENYHIWLDPAVLIEALAALE